MLGWVIGRRQSLTLQLRNVMYMVFMYTAPTEVILRIEAAIRAHAQSQSQQLRHAYGCWNAFLNDMCVRTILFWLQADYDISARIWLANELPALWGVVDGTAILLNQKRLILLPDSRIDSQELVVPQEWVDFPDWAGDYFLAVQIEPEEGWLRLWGYTTHAQLKAAGSYDAGDRTYALEATQLFRDITALWVVQQLHPAEHTQAAGLPLTRGAETTDSSMPATVAATDPTPLRLRLPLPQWQRILSDAQQRQQLYAQWLQPATTLPSPRTNLSQWLQQQFEAGWEAVSSVLQQQPQLAYGLRDRAEPDANRVQRVRSVALEAGQSALLMVQLEPGSGQSPKIRVRLYPTAAVLPTPLSLALLTAAGEVVQWVAAPAHAEFIQLKRFSCPPGQPFWIQVAQADPVFLAAFEG